MLQLKALQSRRLLRGLIKQREIYIELGCDIPTGQYQSTLHQVY